MLDRDAELRVVDEQIASVFDLAEQRIVFRVAVLGDPTLVSFVEHTLGVGGEDEGDQHVSA